ncbi:MAG TPA: hypothetical protein VF131_01310 [Blastocatellia bacterium]|nr:hypothetical protein [Blastocatellia bacterium]
MKRTTGVIVMLLAVLVTYVPQVQAQDRQGRSQTKVTTNKNSKKQTFAPRIRGRSESFIVEGLITAATAGAIRIKTATGQRATFEVDDQTTVLKSGELVSISTLADIELTASDLQIFDRIEIVFEREGGRRLARIITRIQSERDRVARR